MKFALFICLLALAVARPDKFRDTDDHIEILKDDRHHNEDGSYSTKFESENGIKISESGSRLDDVENNPVGAQGVVSFTFPTGEKFELKYVADENGFQPESSWLPVAPEFPHPIPQFVLDQIEKAAREDAEEQRSSSRAEPVRKSEPSRKQTKVTRKSQTSFRKSNDDSDEDRK